MSSADALLDQEFGLIPVVVKEGCSATAEQIKAWANERLGKTQRLAAVELTDELPRSAIGKVLKRELREQFSGTVP